MISVDIVDAEKPSTCSHSNRAIEIVQVHETTILTVSQHPAKVIIAKVQSIVVIIDSPLITVYHIIHCVAERVDEIVIDLIYIFVLAVVQSQFISHLV
jgi:hypothetical protein